MKKLFLAQPVIISLIIILMAFDNRSVSIQQSLTGAWHLQQGNMEDLLVFQDGYFSHTVFDKANKKFISSYGGVYKPGAGAVQLNIEFDTRTKEEVGKEKTAAYTIA